MRDELNLKELLGVQQASYHPQFLNVDQIQDKPATSF